MNIAKHAFRLTTFSPATIARHKHALPFSIGNHTPIISNIHYPSQGIHPSDISHIYTENLIYCAAVIFKLHSPKTEELVAIKGCHIENISQLSNDDVEQIKQLATQHNLTLTCSIYFNLTSQCENAILDLKEETKSDLKHFLGKHNIDPKFYSLNGDSLKVNLEDQSTIAYFSRIDHERNKSAWAILLFMSITATALTYLI